MVEDDGGSAHFAWMNVLRRRRFHHFPTSGDPSKKEFSGSEGVDDIFGEAKALTIFLPLSPSPDNESTVENSGDESTANWKSRDGLGILILPDLLKQRWGFNEMLLDALDPATFGEREATNKQKSLTQLFLIFDILNT